MQDIMACGRCFTRHLGWRESTGTGTGTGTGSVIGGRVALDKINTEDKERNMRQSFDGIDVVDRVDSSEENGRSKDFEGDGGFNGVGGFGSHMRVVCY